MGCFDEKNKLWKTVTKVSGFDDKTMKELQVFLLSIKYVEIRFN